MTQPKRVFAKPWRSFEQQIEQLADRGLADAASYRTELETIGYYRLSGYWYTFRKIDTGTGKRLDEFFDDASMAQVIELYRFDQRLRRAVWAAVTDVELALRVQVGYELGRIDPYVHLRPELLDPTASVTEYDKFAGEVGKLQIRSREDFVAHFKREYDGRLPVWVVTEIMQLGQLVRLFEFAPYDSRMAIAARVGTRTDEYRSWLKALNILRNIVAHHGRLWNRSIGMKPMLKHRSSDPLLSHARGTEDRVYGVLAVLAFLLRELRLDASVQSLHVALDSRPAIRGVSTSAIGLPEGWASQPLWTPDSNQAGARR